MTQPNKSDLDNAASKRKSSLGVVALGIGMLFLAGLSVWVAAIGVVIVVGGIASALTWSIRMKRLKGDAWDYDPDLDGPDPHNRHTLDDRFEKDDEA